MKAAIIIPVYKELLSSDEITSLTRCYDVMKTHDVIFVAPHCLNLCIYFDIFNGANRRFEYFNEKYFSNIAGYNKLLKSKEFFSRFLQYDFMLIYQLDAYIFNDQLEFWCNKSYDFIGAPWFEKWHNAMPENKIIGVGNGGLSLRNVKKSISILKRIECIRILHRFTSSRTCEGNQFFKSFIRLLCFFFNIKNVNDIGEITESNNENEDFFWCVTIPKIFKDFRVAPINDAIKFSFEANPELLYSLNQQNLPFGCHAWKRYSPSFWEQFII